ncbi:MAG: family 78 glycoside hydrolase catalytic domain [Lentisphaeria bacterium]|nr:family 78 glycoside hydrolase catalytic domain [Lentisphaeria bacterium]
MTPQSLRLARPRPLVVEEIPPATARRLSRGHWFYDFGRAAFGTLRLRADVPRDTALVVHLGEKLDAAGRVDRTPPGSIRYRAIPLTLAVGGQAVRVTIPPDNRNTGPAAIRMPTGLFEVLPFRYAELAVEGDLDITPAEVVQMAVFHPFDDAAASFRCDDERLNRVWELCRYSIKATSFCGVYVDGDRERIPYEADAYINQLCHYGVDAEYEMARHSLEYLLFHPTWPTEWSLHCVPMAWADYLYTGRKDMLAAYYDLLQRKALLPLAREDGLISSETGLVSPELLEGIFLHHPHPLRDLVDWPPGSFTQGGQGERDNYDMVPVKTIVNAFHAWNLELLAEIATVLGRGRDAAAYRDRHRLVVESLRRVFFHEERGVFVDGEGSEHASLHAGMIPAALGLVPPGREGDVLTHIRSRGMACSVYGAQYLLEACYRLGDADYALDLMTAEHDRGWLNMLRVGSSVTLEAWDHRYKNNLDWNHAWGAAPANIIPFHLVGVRPATPGFETARIAPRPGRLRRIEATVPTPRGPVCLEFDAPGNRPGRLLVTTPVPARLDLGGVSPAAAPGPATTTPLPPGRHEVPLGT